MDIPRMVLPKNIVAIGASSTFGVGDPEGGGFVGRFKNWYENETDEIVYNLGIPGDTLKGMVKRKSEITKRRAKLIIVQVGSNDCIREGDRFATNRTELKNYKRSLKKFLNDLKDIAPVIFISTFPINDKLTTPVSWAPHYYLLEDVKEYTLNAIEIARSMEIPVIDVMSDWLNKDYELFLSEDGLHPNANGHEYIFHRLRDKFLELYRIKLK